MNLSIDKKLFDGIIYAAAGYSSSVFDAVQVDIHYCENLLDLTLLEEGKKAVPTEGDLCVTVRYMSAVMHS